MKNSYSADIREELFRRGLRELGISGQRKRRFRPCCAASFLHGAFLCAGEKKGDALTLAPGHPELSAISAQMLRRFYDLDPAADGAGGLILPQSAAGEHLFKSDASCDECPKLFLRAAFLACGTVTDPAKSYNAVFRCKSAAAAKEIRAALTRFSLHAGMSEGKGGRLVYLRRGEEIADLLAAMDDPRHVMLLNDHMAQSSFRADNRRRNNCDISNIRKVVNGAQSVIGAIHYLSEKGVLNTLPEPLREAARLRLENPDLPLKELCQLVPGSISKSGLNHRLQKLSGIARELREKEKDSE